MTTYGGVTAVDGQSADGTSSIQIMATEIEGGRFGFGITERNGLSMRQIGAELEVAAARELYESISAYLQRQAR